VVGENLGKHLVSSLDGAIVIAADEIDAAFAGSPPGKRERAGAVEDSASVYDRAGGRPSATTARASRSAGGDFDEDEPLGGRSAGGE
jgi:hypothetical protein